MSVLLDEADAAHALRIAAKIGEALAATPPPRPSLSNGAAGAALALTYLEQALPDRGFADAAMARIDQATDALGAEVLSPFLYDGFSGIAWTAHHLVGRLYESGGEDDREIDDALGALVTRSPWRYDYDLIVGLVGIGVFLADRFATSASMPALEQIALRVEELSDTCADGVRWKTHPEHVPPQDREEFPDGRYNLGLAHGVPGIIGLLADLHRLGVAPEHVTRLLDGGVRWMLSREHAQGYGNFALDDGNDGSSRIAWCYGEPGIAITLLAAARATGRADWHARALAIARRAAARPPAHTGVVDAGLCHGAAGLALIFMRLHRETGAPELAEAARYWIRDTLARHRPGEGFAGYTSFLYDAPPEADQALLTGAAGVALALVAAATEISPTWDRVLLLSSVGDA